MKQFVAEDSIIYHFISASFLIIINTFILSPPVRLSQRFIRRNSFHFKCEFLKTVCLHIMIWTFAYLSSRLSGHISKRLFPFWLIFYIEKRLQLQLLHFKLEFLKLFILASYHMEILILFWRVDQTCFKGVIGPDIYVVKDRGFLCIAPSIH